MFDCLEVVAAKCYSQDSIELCLAYQPSLGTNCSSIGPPSNGGSGLGRSTCNDCGLVDDHTPCSHSDANVLEE